MSAIEPLPIIYALAALAGLVVLLTREHRHYRAAGKAGAWLRLRIASLPIGALTAALVVLPARSVSGMEGLAVFYVLLVVIAPVFWFVSHIGVGRLVRPRLTTAEAIRIAGSPLMLGLILTALAPIVQSVAWRLLH